MNHDHALKKLNLDLGLLTQSPGSGGGGGGGLRANICYHVDAYVNPFNLMCNMTIF